jgi:membrane-bound serine protease (ClpP class)
MAALDPYLLANILYLVLVVGLWLAAMAAVTPGTGLLELTALTALAIAGFGTLVQPFNLWALIPLALGAVFFGLSLRRRQEAVWLTLSAVALSVGSVYLYGDETGPAVHPLLAVVLSLSTVGFFWLTIRRALAAHLARRRHDPQAVVGQVGDVRTPLDPMGTIYVGGELWTARAERPLAVGARVKVRSRDGLILDVEPWSGTKSAVDREATA